MTDEVDMPWNKTNKQNISGVLQNWHVLIYGGFWFFGGWKF